MRLFNVHLRKNCLYMQFVLYGTQDISSIFLSSSLEIRESLKQKFPYLTVPAGVSISAKLLCTAKKNSLLDYPRFLQVSRWMLEV